MSKTIYGVNPVYDSEEQTIAKQISVINSKKCAKINVEDIEVVEQMGRMLHIRTLEKEYSVYEKLYTIMDLLKGSNFYMPLRNMIINFDHLKEVEEYYAVFDSGYMVTMGKNSLSKMREAFRHYLMRYNSFFENQRCAKVAEKR